MAARKPKIPGTTTRAQLEARRGGVVCKGPSGETYKVVRPNLRHEKADDSPAGELDLICRVFVEPEVGPDDLTGDDPLISVTDQEWALGLANGSVEDDGEGKRIWGPESADTFAAYRMQHAETHGCPEGCPACVLASDHMARLFSVASSAFGG